MSAPTVGARARALYRGFKSKHSRSGYSDFALMRAHYLGHRARRTLTVATIITGFLLGAIAIVVLVTAIVTGAMTDRPTEFTPVQLPTLRAQP